MQKSTMLKVVSILFIIYGVLSVFSSIGGYADNAIYGALGILATIISFITAILELAAGIFGIQKKDNLVLCKKLAFALIGVVIVNGVLGMVLISAVANAAGASAGLGIAAGATTGLIAIILGLIFPILYLVGINKSSKQNIQ